MGDDGGDRGGIFFAYSIIQMPETQKEKGYLGMGTGEAGRSFVLLVNPA